VGHVSVAQHHLKQDGWNWRLDRREIKTAITHGKRKDGSPLKPPMGYGYYAKMTGGDLDAVVAYLRTLPAKE
jgi:hypothetical protein